VGHRVEFTQIIFCIFKRLPKYRCHFSRKVFFPQKKLDMSAGQGVKTVAHNVAVNNHGNYLTGRAVENHMRSVSAWQLSHTLRQQARELSRTGLKPYALPTQQQHLNSNLRANQPHQVFFQPPCTAFQRSANARFRRH